MGAGRRRLDRRLPRRPRPARPSPSGRVLVVDEIGFHHATSVAELLADRGCTVEVATPGMVVGQDLGITLDMETWWMRAGAKGIVQSTDLVPDGRRGPRAQPAAPPHRARCTSRDVDWVVLAVPAAPAEALLPRAARRRVCRSSGSATAWRPAGPTPR